VIGLILNLSQAGATCTGMFNESYFYPIFMDKVINIHDLK
jgi:hypothetical protein